MPVRVDGSGFADAVGGLLREYHGKVISRVNEAGMKAVKELERVTKRTAPKRSGEYRKAIRSGLKEERHTGSVYAWYVNTEKGRYRLTHLIVNGHRTRIGTHTRPNPFLRNAVDKVVRQYEQDVQNAVKEEAT